MWTPKSVISVNVAALFVQGLLYGMYYRYPNEGSLITFHRRLYFVFQYYSVHRTGTKTQSLSEQNEYPPDLWLDVRFSNCGSPSSQWCL